MFACVFFVRSLIVITFIPTIFHFAAFLLLILFARVCRQVPRGIVHGSVAEAVLPACVFGFSCFPLPLSETIS